MRIFFIPLFAIFLCLPAAAMAADSAAAEFSGNPVILPSGMIMIEGHKVALWGIDALASDQQCWHESIAWDCGEQALMALRHHLTGHQARCVVKSDAGDKPVSAQCFRKTGNKEDDVARWLVAQGWARDEQDVTDGLYADDETAARGHRRGIWTSRFQSAADWKNGVSHYVNYTPAPPPQPTAAADGTAQ